MKVSIGDKIVALNSAESLGFRKGDEIQVVKRAFPFNNALIGKNLTRPDCYGNGQVWVEDYIGYKIINKEKTVKVFKMFKWLITIKEVNE